jgi:hypothetical protein
VSKRIGSPYRSGRSPHWVKVKNPRGPAVTREAEEDWGQAHTFFLRATVDTVDNCTAPFRGGPHYLVVLIFAVDTLD